MDSDTEAMLRSSLEHVLTETADRPLAERLAELGWDEVLADDAPASLRLLFETKGDTLSNADALGPRLAATLSQTTGDERLGSASIIMPTAPIAGAGLAGEVVVRGVITSPPMGAAPLVVVVAIQGATRMASIPPTSVVMKPAGGNDPELGLWQVTGTVPGGDLTWLGDDSTWSTVVAHGRWLLAAELVGIGRHVVRAAVDYTGQREQYGRKIGTFQALQHRIATAHVLIVGAARVTEEAAVSGRSWDAMVAKCIAGRAVETACTQAQQCYGAIGFTWDHEFHRFLRRTYLLDQLLGSWRSLEHEIGTELQRTRTVPRIGSL
jgi:hypothetical protein